MKVTKAGVGIHSDGRIHLSEDPASSHTSLLFRALFTVTFWILEVTFPAQNALGDFSSCIIFSDIYIYIICFIC